MRAPAALLPALLLLLSSPPAPRAAPLLLVARAACGAGRAAFAQAGVQRHVADAARFAHLTTDYRLLGYEETCGAGWEEAVTRRALAALGAGGGVAAAGRLGARACAALAGAAAALARAQPAPCGEARARGAALAHVARRLRWRRALVAAARPGECGAALPEAERALAAAGVALQRAPGDDERAPHAFIACESSTEAVPWRAAARNMTDVLLLHVAAPAHARTDAPTSERDGSNGKSLSAPESTSDALLIDYFESFRSFFSVRPTPRPRNNDTSHTDIPFNTISKTAATERTFGENATQTLHQNMRRNATEADTSSREHRGAPGAERPHARVDDLDELALNDRLLILSDELFDIDSTAQYPYDEVLEALEVHEEAMRTGVETFRNNFFLYKRSLSGERATWTLVADVAVSAQQPVGAPEHWAARVSVGAAAEGELRRRGDARAAAAAAGEGLAVHAALLALCACVCGLLAAGAACARRAAWRRAPRPPRASPVLAAADFTFPTDERRVGSGMESMLSWLQQLHELRDAPAPSAPPAPSALLQRPALPSAPSSTASASRLAPDCRTRYKGDPVHMKYLPAAKLDLRRKTIDVLLVMQSLRHENLNPFIGCLTEPRPALAWAACARGSLEDVLVADDIALDWTFRLSLLTDLACGMRHLHRSAVRVHARLSSRNCAVDARWVLRVTDYGLPALARAQALPYAPRGARELLWTAPELLREASACAVPGGTQAGDVFSFGIIMQEVIVRGEPYCMLALSPEEIVEKLRRPPPLVRPSVSLGAAPPDAVAVMRQCWSEQPDLRPDFARLADLFRHMHRGRKTNIVDSMFEMLEKYSNNLEELIKDRTEQLDMEKKKTEQLLNRMLPRSVAERLLLGLRVEPEEFADVSVYFSDIVGFTALAARSSPVQVVDLLNDLYSAFDAAIEQYRVYKVETIGDAYMVVGGLPVRCADHAERVASVALALLHEAGRFRIRHLPGAPLLLRSGLHSGACCAGVVGLTMPRYCLFGDTVNTAARMESTGAAWRVQLSAATARRLAAAGGFRMRARGLVPVKGKGAMLTYWLLGKDGFDKPLPTPPPLETEEVLFETESENELEAPADWPGRLAAAPPVRLAAAPPVRLAAAPPGRLAASPPVARQCSDPSPTADKFAWRRSGAASAESSPPAPPRRALYLRASAGCAAAPPAPALRRQWSLERGDSLAAAAAAAEGPAPLEPLALRAPPPRAAPPRYRTRRAASALDVSTR